MSPESSAALPPPEPRAILVVDDEPEVAKSLTDLLQTQGYRVKSVGDGRAAMSALEADRFDLVLTDLAMPDMNGWQLLEMLQQLSKPPLTVLMTGFLPEQGQDILLDSKADGFLVKPIDSRRLFAMLHALLNPKNLGRPAEIVVIDDDAATLKIIVRALEPRGIYTDAFESPDKGISRIRKRPPDLAIIDVNLPGANGLDLIQGLRSVSQTALLPVLVLTSSPSRDYVLRAVDLQVNGFIAKPFDPDALVEKVLQTIRQTGYRPPT